MANADLLFLQLGVLKGRRDMCRYACGFVYPKNLSRSLLAVGHWPPVCSVEPNANAFRLMIPISIGLGSKYVEHDLR